VWRLGTRYIDGKTKHQKGRENESIYERRGEPRSIAFLVKEGLVKLKEPKKNGAGVPWDRKRSSAELLRTQISTNQEKKGSLGGHL